MNKNTAHVFNVFNESHSSVLCAWSELTSSSFYWDTHITKHTRTAISHGSYQLSKKLPNLSEVYIQNRIDQKMGNL